MDLLLDHLHHLFQDLDLLALQLDLLFQTSRPLGISFRLRRRRRGGNRRNLLGQLDLTRRERVRLLCPSARTVPIGPARTAVATITIKMYILRWHMQWNPFVPWTDLADHGGRGYGEGIGVGNDESLSDAPFRRVGLAADGGTAERRRTVEIRTRDFRAWHERRQVTADSTGFFERTTFPGTAASPLRGLPECTPARAGR